MPDRRHRIPARNCVIKPTHLKLISLVLSLVCLPAVTVDNRNAVPCKRSLGMVLGVWGLLGAAVANACAAAGAPATVGGPIVREPVPAQTFDKSLRDAPIATPMQPGQPVRVMPDLRESPEPTPDKPVAPDAMNKDSQKTPGTEPDHSPEAAPGPDKPLRPVVREPVTPKVREKPLDEAAKAKELKPGEPIRVMPDLKQRDGPDSDAEVTKDNDKEGN